MGARDGAEQLEEVCVADQVAPWQLHINGGELVQAQVRHVAPEMMKTYSHIRRHALNEAAAALEPTASQPAPRRPLSRIPIAADVLRHTRGHITKVTDLSA